MLKSNPYPKSTFYIVLSIAIIAGIGILLDNTGILGLLGIGIILGVILSQVLAGKA